MEVDGELMDAMTRRNSASGARRNTRRKGSGRRLDERVEWSSEQQKGARGFHGRGDKTEQRSTNQIGKNGQ